MGVDGPRWGGGAPAAHAGGVKAYWLIVRFKLESLGCVASLVP